MGLFVIGTPRSGALSVARSLAEPLRKGGGTTCLASDSPVGSGWGTDPAEPVHPLTASNRDLLVQAGGSWLVPPPAEVSISGSTGADRARAASALRSAFGDRDWVWSDPQLLVTVGYWLEAAPDARVIVLPGNPAAIDEVLVSDRGLPAGYGAALQRRLLRHALAALETHDKWVLLDGSAASASRATELVPELTPAALDVAREPSVPPDLSTPETDADRLIFELAAALADTANEDAAHIENLRRLNADAERRASTASDLPDRLAAAELGAAELSREFEEFMQRRSVRTVVGIADRFYPSAKKLRARLRRDNGLPKAPTDADASRLTVGSTALGAAARRGDLSNPLTVIVPVYNAPSEVERCIFSLALNTPGDVSVLFVDDGSTDPAIPPLLEAACEREGWSQVRNDVNLGFTRSVNRGLAEVGRGDVILLNADTRVGPKWTWRLRNAVYSDERYGTATPLSDSAGAFSFDCVRPADQRHADAVATAVARGASFTRPEGPTGNGFCMYIPERSLALVPQMDAEAFPRGYGEENDFCMKLVSAGLTHVVADDVVVFHDESASFGQEKQALLESGLATLADKWPDYHQRVQRFLSEPDLTEARRAASRSAAGAGEGQPPRRVLFVSHDGQGGTQHHCDDLVAALESDHEAFLLTPHSSALVLRSRSGGSWHEVQRWHPAAPWSVEQFRSDEMTDAMADLLSRLDIDLVHVHHLIGQTFDVVEIAAAMSIPVVVTIHDYYLACPALNLLDETATFCGGTCTPGPGNCHTPEPWVPEETPLKHNLVKQWQVETTRLLESATAIVAPTDTARRVLVQALDRFTGHVEVIEHGLEVPRSEVASPPHANSRIKVLVAGAVSVPKGSQVLRELIAADGDHQLAFEVLGKVDPQQMPDLADLPVRWHGAYDRRHLPARLARIRPAFVAVLSIWPETYNYVVTEAWAAGVPVVAGSLGAPGERVARTGAGLLVDLSDPAGAVSAIVAAARDERHYDDMVKRATMTPIRSTAEMASDYRGLYSRCLAAVDLRTGAGL